MLLFLIVGISLASNLEFKKFVTQYKKKYSSSEELARRKMIYTNNYNEILINNKKYLEGKVSSKMEVTDDSDLTFEEWKLKV